VIEDIRDIEEQVLAIRRRTLGDEHPDTLDVMHRLADTLRRLARASDSEQAWRDGRSAARALLEPLLAVRRRTLGDDDYDTLKAQDDLAEVLFALGDLTAARPLYEQALSSRRRMEGEFHRYTLRTMTPLLSVLYRLHDWAAARALAEQHAAILRNMKGDPADAARYAMLELGNELLREDQQTYAAWEQDTLAFMVWRSGDDDLSIVHALDALARETLDLSASGKRQSDILSLFELTSMCHSAYALYRQGEHAAAFDLIEQVLDQVLARYHQSRRVALQALHDALCGLARSLYLLANGRRRPNAEITAAVALYEKVLAVYHSEQRKAENPDTLDVMCNLAEVLRGGRGDEPARARALYEQVIAIRRRKLGDEHPDTLRAMFDLARMLAENERDRPAARALFEQVATGRRHALGDEHPDTLTAMRHLAGVMKELDELVAARDLLEQGVATSRRALGESAPLTLYGMMDLASILKSHGEPAAAHAIEQQVLTTCRDALGEDHPLTQSVTMRLEHPDDPTGHTVTKWVVAGRSAGT
jgi:tetratricopeptide (TPR) repeat protein